MGDLEIRSVPDTGAGGADGPGAGPGHGLARLRGRSAVWWLKATIGVVAGYALLAWVALLALGVYLVPMPFAHSVRGFVSDTTDFLGFNGAPTDAGGKFVEMVAAVVLFALVMLIILGLSGFARGRFGEALQSIGFVVPALLMIAVGLLYPAVRTIVDSFRDSNAKHFIGLDNYQWMLTDPDQLIVLRNTAAWVLLTPLLATAIGLVYAVLVDRARVESLAKALVFFPMSISFVGAGIIWKFMYDYRGSGETQIGLLNQVLVWLHLKPYNFLLSSPWNNVFLIVVMVWIQAGFAMTVLSAAIKAIPDDIIEAARLDGVTGLQMFRFVTMPSIRPALIVVLTTISIGTLKVFDIVRTMTNGNFKTDIVAYEFYNQGFRYFDSGHSSALAVMLFVLVVPIIVYNVRQMRKADIR